MVRRKTGSSQTGRTRAHQLVEDRLDLVIHVRGARHVCQDVIVHLVAGLRVGELLGLGDGVVLELQHMLKLRKALVKVRVGKPRGNGVLVNDLHVSVCLGFFGGASLVKKGQQIHQKT